MQLNNTKNSFVFVATYEETVINSQMPQHVHQIPSLLKVTCWSFTPMDLTLTAFPFPPFFIQTIAPSFFAKELTPLLYKY